jgi:hypothetical protein
MTSVNKQDSDAGVGYLVETKCPCAKSKEHLGSIDIDYDRVMICRGRVCSLCFELGVFCSLFQLTEMKKSLNYGIPSGASDGFLRKLPLIAVDCKYIPA